MTPQQSSLPRQLKNLDTSRNSLPRIPSPPFPFHNFPPFFTSATTQPIKSSIRKSRFQEKMQSRLVLLSKLNRILFTKPVYKTIAPSTTAPFSSSASSGNQKTQDDDAMTQGVDTQGETGDPKPDDDRNNIIPTPEDDHYAHPKTVPSNLSSSKLQTSGVNKPIDPHVQQKRTESTEFKGEFSCTGVDGSPWPEEKRRGGRKKTEEDDKEYFSHHKASPLSEIEIGDSRKPLAKVAHATAGGYFGDEKVITWTPEQLDTAEESLLRGMEMFREAAARGVPEWPHSRRLRQLRGEEW